MVLVHHDDVTREFAYGLGLERSGRSRTRCCAAAKQRGWVVISMQID